MKFLRYLFIGVFFGVVMTKSEAISWFRIQEMFLFDSFHMYGIMGTAVLIGMLVVRVIKASKMKSLDGEPIQIQPKEMSYKRYLFGGAIFGLGWSMTGACPGPLYVLVGNGYLVFLVVILSATIGTFVYGLLRNKLPH